MNVQNLVRRTLFGAALILMGFAVSAHHSTAMFEWGAEKELDGTVDKWEWTQPHTFIWLNVPGKGGKVQAWGLEGMSPSWLGRKGWNNKTLAHGDKVKIKYYPLRDGRPGGFFVQVTSAEGKVLQGLPGRPQ